MLLGSKFKIITLWFPRHPKCSILVTACVLHRYVKFLKEFLETAEQHFFVGFNVNMYVFTDRPVEVPPVKMAAGRQVNTRLIKRYSY